MYPQQQVSSCCIPPPPRKDDPAGLVPGDPGGLSAAPALAACPRVTASPRAPGVPGVPSACSQRLPGSAKPGPPPRRPALSGGPRPHPRPREEGSSAAEARWEPAAWLHVGSPWTPARTNGQPSPGHKGLSVGDTPSRVQSGRLEFPHTKEARSQASLGVACGRTLLGRPCGLLVTQLGDFSPHSDLVWT